MIGLSQEITFFSDVLAKLNQRNLLPHGARLKSQSGVKRVESEHDRNLGSNALLALDPRVWISGTFCFT